MKNSMLGHSDPPTTSLVDGGVHIWHEVAVQQPLDVGPFSARSPTFWATLARESALCRISDTLSGTREGLKMTGQKLEFMDGYPGNPAAQMAASDFRSPV